MAITIFGTLYICGATYIGTNNRLKSSSRSFYFIVMTILFIIVCLLG